MIDDPLASSSEAKLTNAYSIITMVIWGDGHISHYAAGDANWENEMKGRLFIMVALSFLPANFPQSSTMVGME